MIDTISCAGGSVIECSHATWAAQVQFWVVVLRATIPSRNHGSNQITVVGPQADVADLVVIGPVPYHREI